MLSDADVCVGGGGGEWGKVLKDREQQNLTNSLANCLPKLGDFIPMVC